MENEKKSETEEPLVPASCYLPKHHKNIILAVTARNSANNWNESFALRVAVEAGIKALKWERLVASK